MAPFKQTFAPQRNVIQDLQQREDEDHEEHEAENEDIKKRPRSAAPSYREEDAELSGKKDRPPSFSTVFATTPAPIPPPVPTPYYGEPVCEKRRRGVFISMPWLIILAIVFFFMLAFILGLGALVLYKIVWYGFSQAPAPIDACNCAAKQAGIQIAPNFVMGGKETTTVTMTVSQTTTKTPTTTPKPSTTTSVVLFTPPPSIVQSTKVIAVDENGNTVTLPASTKSTKTTSTSLDKAAVEASIKSRMESIKSALHPTGTITEIHTSSTPKPQSNKDKPTTTGNNDTTKTDDADVGEGTNPACLGGNDNGAAMHCP